MPAKDDDILKKETNISSSTILYQGALNEGRGIEAMIEAMQYLDCKLILAGEGDLSSLLRKKVEQLNLKEKIIFTGKKEADELRELTKQSFIGINLLENKGLNYYYSLANKFFDYVQAGVPQITMNFPEYKKMNTEFEVAVLIDDLKTETLLSAIRKLMEEKDFYFRLRENCLSAREVWNWQNEEQKLLAFYRQLT
jgi:glycosyltransferase involved in cell wall biosynthesis